MGGRTNDSAAQKRNQLDHVHRRRAFSQQPGHHLAAATGHSTSKTGKLAIRSESGALEETPGKPATGMLNNTRCGKSRKRPRGRRESRSSSAGKMCAWRGGK